MDPLSVTASIAGLITLTTELIKAFKPFITAAVLVALDGLTKRMDSGQLRHASLIQVDHIVTILTDGVLVFSELEAAVDPFLNRESIRDHMPLTTRMRWTWKESSLEPLMTRLQGFKTSISLVLNILQSDTDIRAGEAQNILASNVDQLLQNDQTLLNRLMRLESAFEAQSAAPSTQSTTPGHESTKRSENIEGARKDIRSQGSSRSASEAHIATASSFLLPFEPELQASRVYQRVKRQSLDHSLRSSVTRSHAWSSISSLSMGDISDLSVIALPILKDDIANPTHYKFGSPQAPTFPSHPHLTDNIPELFTLRRKETARSVFQDCYLIINELLTINGFQELFDEALEQDESSFNYFRQLKKVFSRGFPFLILLNARKWEWDIVKARADESEFKRKTAIYAFLDHCVRSIGLSPASLFIVTDVIQGDDVAFLKVVKVLKMLIEETRPNVIPSELISQDNTGLKTKNGSIVSEFLADERAYFSNLETVLRTKEKLEGMGLVGRDDIAEVFGPIHGLVQTQLDLLLDLEIAQLESPGEQRWTSAFAKWQDCHKIYAHFASFACCGKENKNTTARRILKRLEGDQIAVDFGCIVLPTLFNIHFRLVRYELVVSLFFLGQEDLSQPLEIIHSTREKCETIQREKCGTSSPDFEDVLKAMKLWL